MSCSLTDFANRVCRDIPEPFELYLEMENGAGGFWLYRNGKKVDPEDYTCVDFPLLQQGLDALSYAIANGDSTMMKQRPESFSDSTGTFYRKEPTDLLFERLEAALILITDHLSLEDLIHIDGERVDNSAYWLRKSSNVNK